MSILSRRAQRIIFPVSLLAGLGVVYFYNENKLIPERESIFSHRALGALGLMGHQIQSKLDAFSEVLKSQAVRMYERAPSDKTLQKLAASRVQGKFSDEKQRKAEEDRTKVEILKSALQVPEEERAKEFRLIQGLSYSKCPDENEPAKKQPAKEEGVGVEADFLHPEAHQITVLTIMPEVEDVALHLHYWQGLIHTCGESTVQTAITPFVNDVPADLFDDIYVARSDGQVVFQRSPGAVRLTNLKGMLGSLRLVPMKEASGASRGSGDQKRNAEEASNVNENWQTIVESTTILPTRVGNDEYRVFLQPIRLRMLEKETEDEPSKLFRIGEASQLREARLIICGLIREDSFRRQSVETLGPSNFWLVMGIIIIGLMGYPPLKLNRMNDTERLKRWEGLLLGLTIFMGTFLLAPLLQHFYQYHSIGETQQRAQSIAQQIDLNLAQEVLSSLDTLDELRQTDAFRNKMIVIREEEKKNQNMAKDMEGQASPCSDNKPMSEPASQMERIPKILQDSDLQKWIQQQGGRPDFDLAFWADLHGAQRLKMSVYSETTGASSLLDLPFFKQTLCAQQWRLKSPGSSKSDHEFRIASLYSPNTAEYLALISRRSNPSGPEAGGTKWPFALEAIALPFVSLTRPVMPPGFGFAIIEENGSVVFHSNLSRNLRENLFREVEPAGPLEGAVATLSDAPMQVTYQGIPHLFYVTRLHSLEGTSWRLIVFCDLRSRNALYNEVLMLFVTMTFCLWLGSGVLWILLSKAPGLRLSCLQKILWPDFNRGREYAFLLVQFLASLVLFLLYLFLTKRTDVWLASLVVFPFLSTLMIYFQFGPQDDGLTLPTLRVTGGALLLTLGAHTIGNDLGNWPGLIPLLAFATLWGLAAMRKLPRNTNQIPLETRFDSPAFPGTYFMTAVCIYTMAALLPSVVLFRIAVNVEQRLATKQALLQVDRALGERKARIGARFNQVVLPEDEGLANTIRQSREESCLDRYDSFLWEKEAHSNRQACTPPSDKSTPHPEQLLSANPLLAGMVSLRAILPNPAAVATRALAAGTQDEREVSWTVNGRGRLQLTRGTRTTAADPQGMAISQAPIWFISILLVAILILLLWKTLNWIYFYPRQRQHLSSMSEALRGKNLLALTSPDSDAAIRIQTASEASYLIDIREELARRPWLRSIEIPQDKKLVILSHFDWGPPGIRWSLEKLALLERLLFDLKMKVVVLCCSDPALHLEEEARAPREGQPDGSKLAADEIARWYLVLQEFERVIDPQGWALKSEDEAKKVWQQSTAREKLALLNIFEDGWANRKNRAVIEELLEKGLIQHGIVWKVSNVSMEQLLEKMTNAEKTQLQGATTIGGWAGSRQFWMFIAIFAVATIGYVNHDVPGWLAGVIAAIPTAVRLIASVSVGVGAVGKGVAA